MNTDKDTAALRAMVKDLEHRLRACAVGGKDVGRIKFDAYHDGVRAARKRIDELIDDYSKRIISNLADLRELTSLSGVAHPKTDQYEWATPILGFTSQAEAHVSAALGKDDRGARSFGSKRKVRRNPRQ